MSTVVIGCPFEGSLPPVQRRTDSWDRSLPGMGCLMWRGTKEVPLVTNASFLTQG